MLNRGRNIEKGRVITRRMFILAAAKILLFAGISSRLYNLQISDREKYEILSDKNRIREWKTPPQRGIIVDNFNKVLASNDRVFQLHLMLDEINDFDVTIFKIKNIIGLDQFQIKKLLIATDVQCRNTSFDYEGDVMKFQKISWNFLNPKFGFLTTKLSYSTQIISNSLSDITGAS